MCPLALGTQTNGSVIRPASFCGVVGFKPTHGLISRAGVLMQSRTLDHVGVFAREVADVALLADVLAGYDPGDPDTRAGRRAQAAGRGAHARRRASSGWPSCARRCGTAPRSNARRVRGAGRRAGRPGRRAGAASAFRPGPRRPERRSWRPSRPTTMGRFGSAAATASARRCGAMIERGQTVTAVAWHRAVATAASLRQSLEPGSTATTPS